MLNIEYEFRTHVNNLDCDDDLKDHIEKAVEDATKDFIFGDYQQEAEESFVELNRDTESGKRLQKLQATIAYYILNKDDCFGNMTIRELVLDLTTSDINHVKKEFVKSISTPLIEEWERERQYERVEAGY